MSDDATNNTATSGEGSVSEPSGANVPSSGEGSLLTKATEQEGGSLLENATVEEGEKEGEKKEAEKEEDKVPEKYEDFDFDGWDAPLDGDELDQYKTFAKECGLTQKQAQGVLKFEGQRRAVELEHAATIAEQFMSQPGARKTLAQAAKGRDYLVKEVGGLSEIIKDPRVGNNPVIIEVFSRVGKMLGEHSFVEGEGKGKQEKSTEAVLFDKSFA